MNERIAQLESQVAELQAQIHSLLSGAEIDHQMQRTIDVAVAKAISETNLGDLADVDTSGASNGEVLEYDGTNWVPATDNT